jgi:signal peptidase I
VATAELAEGHPLQGMAARFDAVATVSGWLVGTYLLSMLLWVIVPVILFGWTPTVVVSGSMSPVMDRGDVVLLGPVDGRPGPGTVVAYQARDGMVVHRVVSAGADGTYTTKGDANPDIDSTPVRHDQLLGVGRLLVPYIGLARVATWGPWLGLALLVGLIVPAWRRQGWGLAALAGGVSLGIGLAAAFALFLSTTANSANQLSIVDVAPPTGVTASCAAVGATSVDVDITWILSPTSGITGYEILHDDPAAGVDFQVVGSVGPAVTSFTHTVDPVLLGLGAHTYAVQGLLDPWASELSNTDAVDITQVMTAYVCTEP